VDEHWLRHDLLDAHARVQRGIGVLEDHLHAAAELAQRLALQRGQLGAVEADGTGGGLVELEDGAAGRGLATAGLTHQAQRLAVLDEEVEAVHGLDVGDLLLDEQPGRDREVHLETLDVDEVPGGRSSAGGGGLRLCRHCG
jgi:hypothetical protein